MAESILSNKNLNDFINRLKINDEQKKFLIEELPKMDEKERLELFATLTKVFLLDKEEREVIEKIRKGFN